MSETKRNYKFEFKDLIGKVFKEVVKISEDGEDSIKMVVDDNEYYMLEHLQDCCESVYIESIVGDLQDLVGHPILVAEESYNDKDEDNFRSRNQELEEGEDSCTWSFYKFATIKGHVDIRFFGSSNGYYSESAQLNQYIKEDL